MATLLDATSPAFIGALFRLLEHPEMFDRLEGRLATGERTWWDHASADFIDDVANSGRPFYTQLMPDGLRHVSSLDERLARDCRILDSACGTGHGVVRLAQTYPTARVVGADGDEHSLAAAQSRCAEAGLGDRVDFLHTDGHGFLLHGAYGNACALAGVPRSVAEGPR